MTTLTIDKLTPTVGAVVQGIDQERLMSDDALPDWLLDTLEEHGVVVIHDLEIDDKTQVEFSKRLGSVEQFPLDPELPEMFVVSLDPAKTLAADYLKGTFWWHIDGLTEEIPIMATMLSAKAVDPSGGDTEFSSTYGAYDLLSDDEKERFAGIRVAHSLEAAQRLRYPDPTPEQLEQWRARPGMEHPLIWTHRDGRKSLVLGATASHVVGWDYDEGRKFLDDLLDRVTAPDQVYRHKWSVNDLVMWDNRGVLHRACEYEPTSPREMHRTTFTGDEAIS